MQHQTLSFLISLSLLLSLSSSAPAPANPPTSSDPPPPPSPNLVSVLKSHCKSFAGALVASDEAISIFTDNVAGGLTVFCPSDEAFSSFLPKFRNLSKSDKASVLESHAIPTYNSIAMLKSGNGDMSTLATDGARKFELTIQNDGDDVTIRTRASKARVSETALDKDPVAVYVIDKVLVPIEVFKEAVAAPAPAPEEKEADSPEPAGKKGKKKKVADSPADYPGGDEDPADSTADENGGASVRVWLRSGGFGAFVLVVFVNVIGVFSFV